MTNQGAPIILLTGYSQTKIAYSELENELQSNRTESLKNGFLLSFFDIVSS
jgi:hypothetical protein